MKNQFSKNDKLLFHATVAADVLAILCAVIFLIYAIVTIIAGVQIDSTVQIILGVVLLPLGLGLSFIYWVFMKVTINLHCDVKLIRNRLYSIDNEYLRGLIGNNSIDHNTTKNSDNSGSPITTHENNKLDVSDNITNKVAKLKAIKELFDNSILSADEFESEKNKILNSNS